MTQLKLFLLGSPHLAVAGREVSTDRRKAVALLAYLAVTGGVHRRETLAALFWPESDRALAYLRRTLWEINQMVGEGVLAVNRETAACPAGRQLWLDTAEFSTLTAAAHDLDALAAAAALYRSDFMAGFTLRDAPEFDEWQYYQADHYRRELAGALQTLSQALAGDGDHEAAVAHARRWLALDPLHEPAHRQLMRLYAALGERALALRQYETCRQRLTDELGVLPEPETTALYEQIQQGEMSEPAAGPTSGPVAAGNLPLPSTPFVGRALELTEIQTALNNPDVRLLTLVGPGGSGKTRLALAAGRRCAGQFADGVFFVPLAAFNAADDLVAAVARYVHPGFFRENESPRGQLFAYLQPKQLLLIMDNYEHLLFGGGADLVEELLAAAPRLKVLATSRMSLGLRLEHQYPVAGMVFPELDLAQSWPAADIAAAAAPYSALQLFVDRARQVEPGFALDAATLAPMVRLCRLVDGLPLALELAAAWLELLTVSEIETEIRRNIDFLETEARDVPERQRSMRAVFNYSWELLTPAEKAVFPRLAIFHDGFSRAAAQVVAGASLLTIKGLVNKSLIKRQQTGRFWIHELLLGFAAEKLREDPERWHAVRDGHSTFYLNFLLREGRRMGSPAGRAAFDAIAAENENIRAAWLWAMVQRDYEPVLATLSYWVYYALVRSNLDVWLRELVEIVMADLAAAAQEVPLPPDRPGTEHRLYAALLALQAWLEGVDQASTEVAAAGKRAYELIESWQIAEDVGLAVLLLAMSYAHFVDEAAGIALARRGLAALRRGPQSWELAFALNLMGSLANRIGQRDEAKALLQEGAAIGRRIGDDLMLAYNLTTLSAVFTDERAFAEALAIDAECQPLFEKVGDWAGAAYNLWNRASIYDVSGYYELAAAHFARSRQIFTSLGRTPDAAGCFGWEGQMWQRAGDFAQALALRQQALELQQGGGHVHGAAWSLFELGEIWRLLGDKAQSAAMYEASFAEFKRLHIEQGQSFYYRVQGRDKLAAGDGAGARRALAQSLALSGENSEDYWNRAYTLFELGRVSLAAGDHDEAGAHFDAALRLSERWGSLGISLAILTGFVELWLQTGRYADAAALAALISSHQATWAEYRPVAEKLLLDTALHLGPERFRAAKARGEAQDLAATVAGLLGDAG